MVHTLVVPTEVLRQDKQVQYIGSMVDICTDLMVDNAWVVEVFGHLLNIGYTYECPHTFGTGWFNFYCM